jgi:hypothetical protein
MKTKILIPLLSFFLFVPILRAQTNFGGLTAPPPRPIELGTTILTNPGFCTPTGSCTSGTTTGWHYAESCGSAVADSSAPSGYAFEMIGVNSGGTCNIGSGNVFVLGIITGENGNGSFAAHEGQLYSIEISTSSNFSGNLSYTLEDDGILAGPSDIDLLNYLASGGGYINYVMTQYPIPEYHQTDGYLWLIEINSFNTGTIKFTNAYAGNWWYPVQNILTVPGAARGYFSTDFNLSGHYCGLADSSTCGAGTLAGVAEIDPPPSLTASTLVVKLASVAGCGSGVLETYSQSSPGSRQWWTIASGLTAQSTPTTPYYVCTTVTWSDSSTTTYPDWKIYPINSTFRSTLGNFADTNGSWNHNGSDQLVWATSERLSTVRGEAEPGTTKQQYETGYAGLGRWFPLSTGASTGTGCGTATVACLLPAIFADHSAQKFTTVTSPITTVLACNPTGGVGTDTCTPWLEALADYGRGESHYVHSDFAYLISRTMAVPSSGPSAPTLSSSSSSGGTISATYVFVEVVAYTYAYGSSGVRWTLPSSALTVGPLSGSTNQLTVAMPSCPDARYYGWNTYVATNTTNTVPANSAFYLADTDARGEACSGTLTLTSVPTGGLNPPSSDNTDSFLPGWAGTTVTDSTVAQDYAAVCNGSTGAGSGGGFLYITDENYPATGATVWQQSQIWKNYAPGCLMWSNEGGNPGEGPAKVMRVVADVPGLDPFGYGTVYSGGIDSYYMRGTTTQRSCVVYSGNFNALSTVANCDGPLRVILWSDWLGRLTYGTRPLISVGSEFVTGGVNALPYGELRRQAWEAIIAEKSWGTLGGYDSWGWISEAGMEAIWTESWNTQSYYDYLKVSSEVQTQKTILLQQVKDASHISCDTTYFSGAPGCTNTIDNSAGLGITGGQILSNIKSSVAVSTVCGASSGVTTSTTLWPSGFVSFFTVTDPDTGDQYIFAANLCYQAASNMTFTLANPPAGQTSVEARNSSGTYTLSISGGAFTDTWGATQGSGTTPGNDLDVYEYIIRTPRTALIH